MGTEDPKNGRWMTGDLEVPIDYVPEESTPYTELLRVFASSDTLRSLLHTAVIEKYRGNFLHARKNGDIEGVVQRCRTVNFKFTQDYKGFKLGEHIENFDTIAWMQIYLGPNHKESGTNFVGLPGRETPEYKIPFKENYGYFAVNSPYTYHEVEVGVDNRRTFEVLYLL